MSRFEVYKREDQFRDKLRRLLADDTTTITLLKSKIACRLSKQLDEKLIIQGCFFCECNRMAAIPPGAFAVLQIRKNIERPYPGKLYHENEEKESKDNSKNNGFNAKVLQEGRELTPLKYNSKLMNSIWGLYNRYSVHNFKQIDADESGLLAYWGRYIDNPTEARTKGSAVITAGH